MDVREKLIDLIADAKRTDPETGSFTEYLADYLISNGVTVQEWISVKDRLPGSKGQYIVAYHPCYWNNVQENTICVGMDSFMGKTGWAKNKFQRVTHWMPLPEPPKGE